ncbi:MAG: hypothetical protein ACTINV_10125, partial [Cellulosimicrobium funkei]
MSVHRARPRTALAAVLVGAVLVGASTTAHAVPVARAAADPGVAPVATETLVRVVEDGRPGAAGAAASTAAADGTGPDAASGTDPGAGMDSGAGAGAGTVGVGPVVPAVPGAPVPDGPEPPAPGSAAPEEGASPSVPAPDPAAPEEGETPPGPDPTVPDGEPAARVVVVPWVMVRSAAVDEVYVVEVDEGVRW